MKLETKLTKTVNCFSIADGSFDGIEKILEKTFKLTTFCNPKRFKKWYFKRNSLHSHHQSHRTSKTNKEEDSTEYQRSKSCKHLRFFSLLAYFLVEPEKQCKKNKFSGILLQCVRF